MPILTSLRSVLKKLVSRFGLKEIVPPDVLLATDDELSLENYIGGMN